MKMKKSLVRRRELSYPLKKDPSFLTPFRLDNVLIPTLPASYVISKKGIYYFAQPCRHGLERFYGRDASSVIQAAIDSLAAGGLIFVKGGEYSHVKIKLKDNIALIGEKGFTTEFIIWEANAKIIQNYDQVNGNHGCLIENIRFRNPDKYLGNTAIYWKVPSGYYPYEVPLTVRSRKIEDMNRGIELDMPTGWVEFDRVWIRNSSEASLYLVTADSDFSRIVVSGSQKETVEIQSGTSNTFRACYFGGNNNATVPGVRVKGRGHRFISCMMNYYQGIGYKIESADYIEILGGEVSQIGRATDDQYDAISIEGTSQHTKIIGVTFRRGPETNRPKHWIRELDTVDKTLVLDCTFESGSWGTDAVNLIGANSRAYNNQGYVTENSGTASGASPITIPQTTHLLDVDPSYVNAVSKTSGQYVISVSYDSVTKDITIEHSGGATSIDVFWEAKA